jgi:hypothetical protein
VCRKKKTHDKILVGGFNMFQPLLKNMKVRWDDHSQYMEKLKMFQTTNKNLINRIFLELIAIVNVDRTVDFHWDTNASSFRIEKWCFFLLPMG